MDMILIFGFSFLAGLVQGATDGRNIFGSFRPTSSAPNLTLGLQDALINGGHRGLGDGPVIGLLTPRGHRLAALLMASDTVRGDCGSYNERMGVGT
mgnify:CR=1 FL=1